MTNERDKRRKFRIIKICFGAKRQIFIGKIDVCRDALLLSFKIRRQIGGQLLIFGFAVKNDFAERIVVQRDAVSRAAEIDFVAFRISRSADSFRR